MIDILFLLLAFFLTASVFRERELQMDVALPTAETAAPAQTSAGTQIYVTVTEDNAIYLGEKPVKLSELHDILTELKRQFPSEQVVVRGDNDAALGLAVRIMDLAQQVGIEHVSLAVIRPAEQTQ